MRIAPELGDGLKETDNYFLGNVTKDATITFGEGTQNIETGLIARGTMTMGDGDHVIRTGELGTESSNVAITIGDGNSQIEFTDVVQSYGGGAGDPAITAGNGDHIIIGHIGQDVRYGQVSAGSVTSITLGKGDSTIAMLDAGVSNASSYNHPGETSMQYLRIEAKAGSHSALLEVEADRTYIDLKGRGSDYVILDGGIGGDFYMETNKGDDVVLINAKGSDWGGYGDTLDLGKGNDRVIIYGDGELNYLRIQNAESIEYVTTDLAQTLIDFGLPSISPDDVNPALSFPVTDFGEVLPSKGGPLSDPSIDFDVKDLPGEPEDREFMQMTESATRTIDPNDLGIDLEPKNSDFIGEPVEVTAAKPSLEIKGGTGSLSGMITNTGPGDRQVAVILDSSSEATTVASAAVNVDLDGDGNVGTLIDAMLAKVSDLASSLGENDLISLIPSGFSGIPGGPGEVFTITAESLRQAVESDSAASTPTSTVTAAQQALYAPIADTYDSFDFTIDLEEGFKLATDAFAATSGIEFNQVIVFVASEPTFTDQNGEVEFFGDVINAFDAVVGAPSSSEVDIVIPRGAFVAAENLERIDSDGFIDVDASGAFELASLLEDQSDILSAADIVSFELSIDDAPIENIDVNDLEASADGFEFSLLSVEVGELDVVLGLDTDGDGTADVFRALSDNLDSAERTVLEGEVFEFILDAFFSDPISIGG